MQTQNVENDREAQFLAAQNARLANIRKPCEHDANDISNSETKIRADEGTIQYQRKAFWSAFKDECAALSSRLDTLYCSEESKRFETLYVTAQQRNVALAKLQDILCVIRALQHYTIDSNKLTIAGEEYLPLKLKDVSMPELPVADQRLTNIEIQTLKDKSQVVQNVICPKEKFRFHRYRNLLDKREFKGIGLEEEHDANIVANEEEEKNNEPSGSLHVLFNGMTLVDKKNCNLIVQRDGSIASMDSITSDDVQVKGNAAKSFLVRTLDNCQITVEGTFESIHIIDTKNTTLRITTPTNGPVHVTNCHNTQIHIAFARQLRIHNCTNVSFECHVASGPIIEECKKMKFYQQDYLCEEGGNRIDDQNLFWDVKDFQWLKTLVKSPNFDVFSYRMKTNVDTSCSQHGNRITGPDDRQHPLTADQGNGMDQDESSDEDEL